MIIPSNFLVKTITLYSEGDVSTPHVVINYLARSLFFILLKFPPNENGSYGSKKDCRRINYTI